MTTRFIILTLMYIISMEFLPLRNVPIGEERGEAALFAGYETSGGVINCGLFSQTKGD